MKRLAFYALFFLAIGLMAYMGFSWNAPAMKTPCKQNDTECKLTRDSNEIVNDLFSLLSLHLGGVQTCLPAPGKQSKEFFKAQYTDVVPFSEKESIYLFFLRDKQSGAYIVPIGIDIRAKKFVAGYELLGNASFAAFNPPYLPEIINRNQKTMDEFYKTPKKAPPPVCNEGEAPYPRSGSSSESL